MSPDIHTLTGAYSVDALDEVERRRFEAHLIDCTDCAQEVRELRATAARLAMAVAERPPDAVRQRVLAQIGRTRQEPPAGDRPRRRAGPSRGPGNRWLVRLTAAAAAIAIAAAVALGAVAVHTGHQLAAARAELGHDRALYQPVAQVLAAPDARVGGGTSASGANGLVMFSPRLNRAVLLASNMPKAPAGRVYQAWLLGAGSPRSAGLLVSGPGSATAPLAFSGVAGTSMIGITVEPAGGSPRPAGNPVLVVSLPA